MWLGDPVRDYDFLQPDFVSLNRQPGEIIATTIVVVIIIIIVVVVVVVVVAATGGLRCHS